VTFARLVSCATTALRLDPGDAGIRSCSQAFSLLGDYERAHFYARLDAGSQWSAMTSADIYLRQGRRAEALERARRSQFGPAHSRGVLEPCLTGNMTPAVARRAVDLILKTRDPEPKYHLGAVLTYCGAAQEGLTLVKTAVEGNYCAYPAMEKDPLLASVRHRPEYVAIVAEAKQCRDTFEKAAGLK
jgi:hypothetical protein